MPDPGEWSNQPVYHPCPADSSCRHCNGSPGAGHDLDWSFLDAAYCISLKTREDRGALAAAEFHRVGLCRHVTFYRPDKHPRNGFIGSWMSHREVAMHALERGCERTLICEDDVLFTRRIRPATLRAIERALRALPADWAIFFLGHWPLAAYFVRHNVLRRSSGCSHAYVASPRLSAGCAITPGVLPACSSAGSRAKGSTPRTRSCRAPTRCFRCSRSSGRA